MKRKKKAITLLKTLGQRLLNRKDSTLSESDFFLETILDHLPHMVFVKEARDLRFVRFNKAGEKLLGITNEEIIGKNDYDLFPKEQADAFTAKDREVLNRRETVVIQEEPIQTPHGLRYLHTQKITITDRQQQPLYLLGISIDVTEDRKNRELIELQKEKLIQSARLTAVGEMASGIAHEINNPLAIIATACQHLVTRQAERRLDDAALDRNLGIIQKTVTRIARIITGLRDFSRDGEDDPFEPVAISDVLEATLPYCRERFAMHGIDFQMEAPSEDWRIECQVVRLSQVILNLLNNAFDAVSETGRLDGFVKLKVVESATSYQILVEDNGVGLVPETETSIMLPFFTTKPVGKGTGLGLSISAGIVKDHGGEIQFRRRKEGTEFSVTLPKFIANEVAL